MDLLGCVDKLKGLRAEIDVLLKELVGLHAMAARISRYDTYMPVNASGVDIHQQVEIVDSSAFELIEAGEQLERALEPIQSLFSDAVLDKMEDEGLLG